MSVIQAEEVSRLQTYMQDLFKSTGFALKMREKATDSVEVLLNGEFIGLIYKDEEDGETSYNFSMAILDMDLPASVG